MKLARYNQISVYLMNHYLYHCPWLVIVHDLTHLLSKSQQRYLRSLKYMNASRDHEACRIRVVFSNTSPSCLTSGKRGPSALNSHRWEFRSLWPSLHMPTWVCVLMDWTSPPVHGITLGFRFKVPSRGIII